MYTIIYSDCKKLTPSKKSALKIISFESFDKNVLISDILFNIPRSLTIIFSQLLSSFCRFRRKSCEKLELKKIFFGGREGRLGQ